MFKPGDILLFTAPSFKFSNIVPRLIRLITGNKIVHVAIYLGSNREGQNIILDTLFSGVSIRFLSDSDLMHRSDGFDLYGISYLPGVQIPSKNIVYKMAAMKYTQCPYGYLTMLNLLLQHGKTRIFPKKSWSSWFMSKDAYICSQVCQLVIEDVLNLNGISLPFDKLAELSEPDDFLKYPWEVITIA